MEERRIRLGTLHTGDDRLTPVVYGLEGVHIALQWRLQVRQLHPVVRDGIGGEPATRRGETMTPSRSGGAEGQLFPAREALS